MCFDVVMGGVICFLMLVAFLELVVGNGLGFANERHETSSLSVPKCSHCLS
jgi:hypothetical protein